MQLNCDITKRYAMNVGPCYLHSERALRCRVGANESFRKYMYVCGEALSSTRIKLIQMPSAFRCV
jgi:hypothetical protein